jgi:nucleotide-binding universal stress UspA family protein
VGNCVRRIIVGVDGSVGSLRALRRGVDEARSRGAVVYTVLAWTPPGGEMVDRRAPDALLCNYWQRTAWERLRAAWNDAIGGFPSDVDTRLLIVRGAPGPELVRLADDENDLLVVGAGRRSRLRRAFAASVARYCTARASCPVLVVPPSPLAGRLENGIIPRILRRRRAVAELVSHVQQ